MLPTAVLICCTAPSEAVPVVYLASVCRSLQCLISALTQTSGGGLLFRFASSVALQGVGGAAFPVYAAQAPGCSIWGVPCVPALGYSTKAWTSTCACVLCLPRPSSSGSQELDGCTLPRCGAPSPLCGPSLNFRPRLVSSRDPPGRCRPCRVSGSLWLETGGLFAVW